MIKQAFVLGAGLGTRLRPLTDDIPKPLLPIYQKPLITFCLDHLIDAGVAQFIINTHHLPQQFDELFHTGNYRGRPVRLVHEPRLLETGGGTKNVERFLAPDPFIVYSGDLLTDVDLSRLIEEHFRADNDVTLALRKTGLAAGVTLDNGRITAIGANDSGPGEKFDYANISVWTSKIFSRITAGSKVSFIPVLVDWISAGGRIGGVVLDSGCWFNIGSRREYLGVHRTISEQRWRPTWLDDSEWPTSVARTAVVAPSARVDESSAVAAGCHVGENAVLQNTVAWPGAQIASRSTLQSCIVRSRTAVGGAHTDQDI